MNMQSSGRVLVYGAAGHTGRFVVAELMMRGVSPVIAGRDAKRLEQLKTEYPAIEARVASTDDSRSLDDAFASIAVVINCAGPFLDTSAPLIEAALRNGVHYLDIAAEQAAVIAAFERFSEAAQRARIIVAPALGFYGGLTDLLVTAAMHDWTHIYECEIAVALDSWHPTRGTRLTGERNTGPRWFFAQGNLERRDPLPSRDWEFPQPFGRQEVASLALAEAILIPRHVQVADIRFYLNKLSIAELSNPNTPPPVPQDATGRSAQTFLVDVVVRKGQETRRAIARGRDIYAVTAPIVVEAATRILDGRCNVIGVQAAGELFDARDFLIALGSDQLTVQFGRPVS
jgi:hypothetical protein